MDDDGDDFSVYQAVHTKALPKTVAFKPPPEDDFFDPTWFASKPLKPLLACRVPTIKATVEHNQLYDPWGLDQAAQHRLHMSVLSKLFTQGPFALSDVVNYDFEGNGFYILCYCGDLPLYSLVRSLDARCAIYGGRTSRKDEGEKGLCQRFRNHYNSILQTDLGVENFVFRYCVTSSCTAQYVEEGVLLPYLSPVWNKALSGFGSIKPVDNFARKAHERRQMKKSAWDAWHPGRKAAGLIPRTLDELAEDELKLRAGLISCRRRFDQTMEDLDGQVWSFPVQTLLVGAEP